MNIYLLSQTENTVYDAYSKAVVIAKDEASARNINPGWRGKWEYGDWASCPENVNVKLLGEASEGSAEGVVIASFNAGYWIID